MDVLRLVQVPGWARWSAAAAQEQVRAVALTDELTGLPNRRGFLSHGRPMVELSMRHGEAASVLFLDLDGLKQVNDVHGHAAGDRLIATAAEVLRRSQGPRDLCARLGGDEFTVLLHGCSPADVPARIAWLEELAGVGVAASIGAAHPPRDASSLDALVDHADKAMLVLKQQRRRYPRDTSMRSSVGRPIDNPEPQTLGTQHATTR